MRRPSKPSPLRALAASIWLAALLLAAPAGAEIVNGIAARVNSEIITKREVSEAMTPFMLKRGIDPRALQDPARRAEVEAAVLDNLIEQKLLVEEAKKLNVSVTPEQVDRQIAQRREREGLDEASFQRTIEGYGIDYDDYRELTRQEMLVGQVAQFRVTPKLSVSDADVESAFRARYGEEGESERYVTFQHIIVIPDDPSEEAVARARERAEAALSRLKSGEAFGDVAAEVSDGPSARDPRGVFGTFRRAELDPEIAQIVFALDQGELSSIERTRHGFHIARIDSEELRASADVRERKEQIRNELLQRAFERQLKLYMSGLRARAFVDVKT